MPAWVHKTAQDLVILSTQRAIHIIRCVGESGDIALAYGQLLVPDVRYALVSWKSI